MMEANPSAVMWPVTLPCESLSMYSSAQPHLPPNMRAEVWWIGMQTGNGGEVQVRNKKRKATGLLSDKRVHTAEMRWKKRRIGILPTFLLFFFWPAHNLMCYCGPWATQGPVVKLFTRLNGSFPFEGIACSPAPHMPDTDFSPAVHPCLCLQLSRHLTTMFSATAGCGAE